MDDYAAWGLDRDPDVIPRTVRAAPPRAWDGPAPVIHTDGLLIDGRTAEAASDAPAFLAGLGRGSWCLFTDSPAALAAAVEDAGGVWQGSLRERRMFSLARGPSERRMLEGAVTKVKLPGADRWAVVVCLHLFLEVPPAGDSAIRADRLLRFARDYLAWCSEHGFAPRPSRGSWGAAFLKDPRFWPAARRKVPRMLNRIAREHLPGNHYERLSDAPHHPACLEVDMSAAHHQAALAARFPHPDRLGKSGSFRTVRTPDRACGPGHVNERAMWRKLRKPGLFRLVLRFPAPAAGALVPPYWPAEGGEAERVLWSPELQDALARGAEVVALYASITSPEECDGLRRYARWALDELDTASDERKAWLKGVLLATYGVAAQEARAPATLSSRPMPRSSPEIVVLAGETVDAHVSRSTRASEPGYVNVLARGIIETDTRVSLVSGGAALARDYGLDVVVALYADGILVDAGPMIPHKDVDAVAEYLAGAGVAPAGRERAYAIERLRVPQFMEHWKANGPRRQAQYTDYAAWAAEWVIPGFAADSLAGERAKWRAKEVHRNLRFRFPGTPTHWEADDGAKLPGVPRANRKTRGNPP